MNIIKSLVPLSFGIALGVGTVLSCSDSSPHRSDAAACDCPASEAPIAGRLATIDGTPRTLKAGEQGGATTACMRGTQFLSGSCTAADPTVLNNIEIQEFGFDPHTSVWFCVFKNNELTAVQVKATALCLKPPV